MDVEDLCDDTEETEVLEGKPIPMPVCAPQIPRNMCTLSAVTRSCFHMLHTKYKEGLQNIAVTLSACLLQPL